MASEIVRLHVADDGMVWHGDETCLGESLQTPVKKFMNQHHDLFAGATEVRLLGSRRNARLIIDLYEGLPGGCSILLGSPAVCLSNHCHADPRCVLRLLHQPEPTSMLSGLWHYCKPEDYRSYILASALADGRNRLTGRVCSLLAAHPAWVGLSFLHPLDQLAACQLLTWIIDPRWFIHPSHPARLSRLFMFLGLTPYNFVRLKHECWPLHERAALALRTWFTPEETEHTDDPGSFLYTTAERYRDGGLGLLRATQRLISFLVAVWLAGIYPSSDMQFVPERFFQLAIEQDAYRQHAGRCP